MDAPYSEVWPATQRAMQRARFETAGTGAMHERLEKDRAAGTLRYIWSDGVLHDVRIVELRIKPVSDPATARTISVNAWNFGFFGFVRLPDGHASEEACRALDAESQAMRDAARTAPEAPSIPPPPPPRQEAAPPPDAPPADPGDG